jgi:tetratricopeptide (TPR) repeat protein
VDGTALRSLLWHSKYADLDRYFAQFEDAFEADNKREYWIGDAADAFSSAESTLLPKFDAWVSASPDSFAPYLARGAHWNAVGWARRGTKWAKDTPEADKSAMHEALDKAVADLDRAIALRPKLVAARLLRLRAITGTAPIPAMRAEVNRATKTCPGCIRIRVVYLLNTRPRWGGTYEAMHAFAAKCDPALNVRCRILDGFVDYDLATLAWEDKRLPDAEVAIDRAIALGDSASFLVERSGIRLARGNYEGALADADRALSLWFGSETLVARAEALCDLKRWELAGRALLDAVRLDPTEGRAKQIAASTVTGLLNEAWTHVHAGRRDDALRVLDLAAELAPSDSEVSLRRSQTLLGTNPDIPALEAAVDKNPDDLRMHQQLDYALSRKNDYGRIATMWTTFIAAHPDEARAYMERAGTYHHLGREDEARADAAKACDLGISEGCMRAGPAAKP